MPKVKNKTFLSNRRNKHEPALPENTNSHFKRYANSDDFNLEIEEITKGDPKKILKWPSHMLIFGSTQAGKTSLIADMLDNINKVYIFDKEPIERKLIVVSPIPQLEIADKMSSTNLWDMELYNNLDLLSEDFEDHLINQFRKSSPNAVNILLLDDILTHAKHNQIDFLNKLFAYFRHINVSILATVHSYDIRFSTIIDQSGLIITMFCLNTSNVIRNILMRYLYKGTAKVWKEVRRIFISHLRKHDYLCLNFSKESLSSEVFFITDTLFNARRGVTLSQIVNNI